MPLSPEAVAVHSAPIVRANLAARLMRNPMGLASAIVIVVVLIAAVFASVLAPFDPNHTDAMNIMAAPGGTHLLGTDSAGRDIFSRILFGIKTKDTQSGMRLYDTEILPKISSFTQMHAHVVPFRPVLRCPVVSSPKLPLGPSDIE